MDEVVMAHVHVAVAVAARPVSARGRLRALLMRRRKSAWDSRVEEEQRSFGHGLRVFEPRPKSDMVMGSISEVLEGKW
jgi:hypothetical protein